MIGRRAQGPRGPQAPRAAHRVRRRHRRLDGQRHLHPHRHACRSRSTGLFAASYGNTDAVIPRQGGRQELHERQRRHGPRLAARRGPRPARGRRRGRRGPPAGGQRRRHHRPGRQGGRPRRASAASYRHRQPALHPAEAQDRRVGRRAAAGRRSTPAPPPRSTTRSATRSPSRRSARSTRTGHRHRLVRRRRLARLRQHRGLGHHDRADAARPRGPLRLDLDRGEAGHLAGRSSCGPSSRSSPANLEVKDSDAAGRRTTRRTQRQPGDDPLLPARLRRHRAVRRRVRDLQHAVDHGRPAHARVRHAADARRLAQAGHALGRARGPRDRPRRLASSGSSLGSGSPRAWSPCSARSASTCRRPTTVFAPRTIIVSLLARHRDHAARQHPARAPGDPRAADRGGPRGRDAAAGRASPRTRPSAGVGVVAASLAAIAAGIFAGGVSAAAIGAAARRRRARAVRSASRCSRRGSSSRSPASSAGRRAAPAASPASWPAPTPSATPAARRRPPPR